MTWWAGVWEEKLRGGKKEEKAGCGARSRGMWGRKKGRKEEEMKVVKK